MSYFVRTDKMAAKTQSILIFGATGLIGEHITAAILDNAADFKKVAIFTSSNNLFMKSEELDALKARGAEVIAGDITSAVSYST